MLRGGAGEVDLELVAGDGHGRADLELAAVCGLQHVGRLEAPVRNPRDRRAHEALRVGVELVHRGLDPVGSSARAELVETTVGEPVRRQLRTEVAAALVRVAHARDEAVECRVVQARRRDHDALLVEPARARGQAAGLPAADVGVVRARDREADGRARDERDVGQVRPARERVVEDEDVARPGIVRADGGDGVGHRAEMDGDVLGLGDHAAAPVEERGRAVAPLLDVRGERGPDQDRAHLLRDRTERGADQLELKFHFFHALVTHS